MRNFDKIKSSIYIIYAILLTLILILTAVVYTNSYDTSNTDTFSVFNVEWRDENNNIVDLEKLKNSTTATCDLPKLDDKATLFFRVKNLNLKVYIDGKFYKQYGHEDISKNAWYETPGTYYAQIRLHPENSKLTLEIINPYKNDSSCNIKQMYIGDGQSIIRMFVMNAMPGFCICTLIVTMGVILCVLSFIFRKYDPKNKDLLSLGLFACIIGVWSMTETRMIPLLADCSSAMHLLASSTLMLLGVPILIFFKDRGNTNDKVAVPLVSILTITTFTVSYILHFSGIADMHETIMMSHITVIVSCLFILYYAFRALRKSSIKDPIFLGLLGIGGCSLLDTILYYFQLTTDNSAFARIGVLIYISMLAAQLISRYIEAYSENAKAAMLTKMAYFDLLTGFYNHNSFASDIKIINKNPDDYKDKAIIVFDMNCLKYINDNMGHAMGDKALKESSEFIQTNFGRLGKCYRIGGDEYAVITDEPISIRILNSITEDFLNAVYNRNQEEHNDKPYPLYIATGFSIISTDATTAFNEADEKMYANKQEIKTKLKLENAELVRS